MINEYKFISGQRLLLELQTELIEGDYDSGAKNRIDLINIVDRINNIKVKDKLSFYRNEIVEIRCLDESSNSENLPANDTCNQLTKSELDHLAELTLNFIYINKPEEDTYKKAIDRLGNSESISVVGLSGKALEIDRIRILVISIATQIYMFDIFVWPCKTFPNELKEILSSHSIRKIVHNSQLLKARLWNCHQVQLNNIFDTQVADAMIHEKEVGQKLEKMKNLSECLLNRLHLPLTLLEQIQNVDAETWDKRPLDFYQVRKASFLGTYLITLKNELQKIMLKHFHNSVSLSANSLRNMSFYQSLTAAFSLNIPDEQKNYLAKENDLLI